jgi:hypothetical protein
MQGTNVAEDKKTSGPATGKDLASKIATAYRSLPPEQRAKPAQDSTDVQNPELDQAFDKMVEMYKIKRPERENSVVTFPAPPTVRATPPPAEPAEEYECPECGHNNQAGNQFCGMCGAAREDVTVVSAAESKLDESGEASASSETGAKHHHHYYHHHHYRNNPYLLAAVVLLLIIIAWQQWREYQQATRAPAVVPAVTAPAVTAQPQPATPEQSNPAPSPAVVPGPDSKKPATKSPNRPPTSRPAVRQGGQPPGPEAGIRGVPSAPTAPLAPYHLTDQQMPALQPFSSTPSKPQPAK